MVLESFRIVLLRKIFYFACHSFTQPLFFAKKPLIWYMDIMNLNMLYFVKIMIYFYVYMKRDNLDIIYRRNFFVTKLGMMIIRKEDTIIGLMRQL